MIVLRSRTRHWSARLRPAPGGGGAASIGRKGARALLLSKKACSMGAAAARPCAAAPGGTAPGGKPGSCRWRAYMLSNSANSAPGGAACGGRPARNASTSACAAAAGPRPATAGSSPCSAASAACAAVGGRKGWKAAGGPGACTPGSCSRELGRRGEALVEPAGFFATASGSCGAAAHTLACRSLTSCSCACCLERLPSRASASEAAALEGPAPSPAEQPSAPVTKSRSPLMVGRREAQPKAAPLPSYQPAQHVQEAGSMGKRQRRRRRGSGGGGPQQSPGCRARLNSLPATTPNCGRRAGRPKAGQREFRSTTRLWQAQAAWRSCLASRCAFPRLWQSPAGSGSAGRAPLRMPRPMGPPPACHASSNAGWSLLKSTGMVAGPGEAPEPGWQCEGATGAESAA